MAHKFTKNSSAILLFPLNILKTKNIICGLEIKRGEKTITYNTQDLDNTFIKQQLNPLPNPAKSALYGLSYNGLSEIEKSITDKYNKQKSGKDFEDFFAPAFLRAVQDQFEYFKPFSSLVKWYHQLPNPNTGNMMTAPCSFSTYKPLLQFEVVKVKTQLQLNSIVNINNASYNLNSFRRFYFLLESKNEYFLLAKNDFQILEWLAENNPAQYADDANLLAQNILSKLEEHYTVERNNLFAVTTVEVIPRHKIMLSEISNSFLVLTPQWDYDGYIAEGEYKPTIETTNNGEAIHIKRNKEIETEFRKQLVALHPNFVKQLNGWYYLSFGDAQKKQWFSKVYHQLLEMDVDIIGMDMLTHFRYSPHKAETKMNIVNTESNFLTMDFSLQFGTEIVPTAELQKMLIAGQKAVMLKDGALGILSEEWITYYGTIIKHSKVDKKVLIVPKWLALSNEKNEATDQTLKITITEKWWALWEQWQLQNDVIYPVSKKINATLRPYQQKGYEWLKLLAEINAGACLADDMGLGKTLQTICFINDRLEEFPNDIALIICPSSLIYNWQQELNKFAPHLRTYIHHGTARNVANFIKAETDICITSYGTMRSDIEQLSAIFYNVIVIDESHNIKNPAAQSTRAIYQLHAGARVALSGTPVMNNTFDLYSQLEFLLPGMFGTKDFFRREYADAIDRDKDPEKIVALQKLTAPFILRRTKEQVAKDLPEKTESIMWCNMSMQQKDMYNGIKENIKSNLFLNIQSEGIGKSKLAVLQGIMKLKQVCSSPLLLPKEEQETTLSVKTEILIEELKNLTNNKVLVFSQFKKMLDLLADAFTKKGITFYQLDGSTLPKQRAALVEKFQAPENTTNVFLISLLAGNTGLTLTAADYVFLFDPWWNNAVQQQAIDRTHRIGQTKNVFAYKLICKDTIEEKIIQLQQRKTELSDNLIGDTEGFVKNLSKEDVEFLFS
jgi:superfamily II DNA or RNA helicase